MSINKNFRVLMAIFVCGCAPSAPKPILDAGVNYDGLEQVNARGLDVAFVRPGIDFGAYSGLLLVEPELAFRTPDRSQREFPLSEVQKDRFNDLLTQQFRNELTQSTQLTLVEKAGPEVLKLAVRVQDINATVQTSTIGNIGRAAIFLEAIGEATIVLELHDSQSDEVLARAIDARAVEGAAALQKDGGALTTWSEVEDLCERWASITRQRLNTITARR